MPARWPASPVSVPSTTPVLNRAVLAPPLSGSHRVPGPQLPIRPCGARALCRPPRAPHPVSPFLHGAPASPPRPAPDAPHPGPRPAFILGRCTDALAAHRLARDVLTDFDTLSAPQRNLARYYLLDPEARCRVVDWEQVAAETVAVLRPEAGRHPHDRRLADVVENSPCAARSSRPGGTTIVSCIAPMAPSPIGIPWSVTSLLVRVLPNPRRSRPTLCVYNAEPGSATAEALRLLSSWTTPGPQAHPSPADTR
nr:transcriptional regulator [Streptomyces buecherae]